MSGKAEWNDVTSYSRDKRRGEVPPSAWSISAGPLRVWVGKNHLHNPGFWTMHCRDILMDAVDLRLPDTVHERTAQSMALSMVARKLEDMSKAVRIAQRETPLAPEGDAS